MTDPKCERCGGVFGQCEIHDYLCASMCSCQPKEPAKCERCNGTGTLYDGSMQPGTFGQSLRAMPCPNCQFEQVTISTIRCRECGQETLDGQLITHDKKCSCQPQQERRETSLEEMEKHIDRILEGAKTLPDYEKIIRDDERKKVIQEAIEAAKWCGEGDPDTRAKIIEAILSLSKDL